MMPPSQVPCRRSRTARHVVRVKLALLLADTVSAVAAPSVSDPLPVQPLTVKVLPPAVSVRLAVVNPPKVNVGRPVTATATFLASVTLLDTLSTRVSAEPLSVPLPDQPVMVNVLPPAVSVKLAVVIPLKPSVMPSVEESDEFGQRKASALSCRDDSGGRRSRQ